MIYKKYTVNLIDLEIRRLNRRAIDAKAVGKFKVLP